MNTKKRKREVHWWLRDPSMKVMPGDELLDKHLTFPRREMRGPILVKGRYKCYENGKLLFDVEARSELEPVMRRLGEALLQEKLLIEQLRVGVERPLKSPRSRRPPTLKLKILKAADSLTAEDRASRVSLAVLVERALKRDGVKTALRHIRETLKDAEARYPEERLHEALRRSLNDARAPAGARAVVVSADERVRRQRVAAQEAAAREHFELALDDAARDIARQYPSKKRK